MTSTNYSTTPRYLITSPKVKRIIEDLKPKTATELMQIRKKRAGEHKNDMFKALMYGEDEEKDEDNYRQITRETFLDSYPDDSDIQTATEKVIEAQRKRLQSQKVLLFGDWDNKKEEEDKMQYQLMRVMVVDTEEMELVIDEKVIAKNEMEAKGKAGYLKLLEEKDYDTEKLEVELEFICYINKYEEDKDD